MQINFLSENNPDMDVPEEDDPAESLGSNHVLVRKATKRASQTRIVEMRLLLISTIFFVTAFGQYGQRSAHIPVAVSRPQRPVQKGYITDQRSIAGYRPAAIGGYGPQGVATGFQVAALDYNPALAGGIRGYPGIKARINQRGFQYFSTLISPILDREIKRARIPPISQCIPEVNGCIQVYNLYVSRYRCPQRVVLYPAPPNKIVIAVQNLDVGVTGNLGGQINILIPIGLSGIVQVNAHQVSLVVELAVSRGPTGTPSIQVVGCTATVGYLDAYIENGGLIGDIANSQFRSQISSKVRAMLPSQLCGQLPGIVNSKLNGQLGGIPQTIALTQMLQLAGGALGFSGSGRTQCASTCGARGVQKLPASSQPLPSIPKASAPPPPPPPPPPSPSQGQVYSTRPANAGLPPPRDPPPPPSYSPSATAVPKANPLPNSPYARKHVRVIASGAAQIPNKPISNSHFLNSASNRRGLISNRFIRDTRPRAQAVPFKPTLATGHRALGVSGVAFPQAPPPNPCGGCPGANDDTLTQLREITKYLDISKLNDIYLTVQVLQGYATLNDYTIELNGEFSPGGQGGTPFGAFPMQFPYPVGGKMAEILISDYTINSLFYSLHRKNFLSVRIGPETPKIGPLLKTTCSDDEEELEDGPVETDEAESTRRRRLRVRKSVFSEVRRIRRQNDEEGGLADLGICLGDILPVRDKYPNQNITIDVRTSRAPSAILSSRNGGTAILDLQADAILSTQSGQNIGTIRIDASFEVTIRATATGISGHGEITRLKLTNPDGNLGLSQEALDNLGNLGKEFIAKAANDVLEKGIPLSIPSGGVGGLPINFIAPEFHILEHAIHLESDFTISPAFLDQLAGGGGFGGVCRR
ncbi:hypothetical protein FO519_003951 [Halicephalobus sp. NKZ332]|nr:hypothetical protein FO519_003951 [Halicephalobus sp. NKZ332]